MLLLGELEPGDAVEMLATTIGPGRVKKERQPSRDLANLCGLQPQALRATGTAVANRPDWDIRLILDQARSGPSREASGRGNFDAAYALLTADERQALRILGLMAAADFAPWMLAAALKTDEARGSRLASRLADAGFIERYSPGSGTPSYRAEESVLNYALLRARAEDESTEAGQLHQLIEQAQSRRDQSPRDGRMGTLDQLLALHGGFTPAIEEVRSAMSLARELGSRAGEAEACAALAELYADLGDMIAAEDLAQRARMCAAKAEAGHQGQPSAQRLADRSRARALRCLVRIERRRHHLDLAIQYADEAANYALRSGDHAERVRVLQEKAVVLARQGAADSAEQTSLEALRLCESLPDAGESLVPGVQWCRGSVLLHTGRYEEAARLLDDGYQAAVRLGHTRMAAWIDQASAAVDCALHQLDLGEQHATRGMEAFTALRHRYGTAHCRYHLGQVYNGRHDPDEAVRSLRGARETFRNCGDLWIEGEVALELADAYRRLGQTQDAIRLQRLARNTYRELDGHAEARQATWALLRTLLSGPLPRHLRQMRRVRSRPGVV